MGPVGTGFIVSMGPVHGGEYFRYVVTASHVVSGPYPTEVRAKRLRFGKPMTVEDHPIPDWVHHPSADVAIARYSGPGVSCEVDRFVGSGDAMGWQPELG